MEAAQLTVTMINECKQATSLRSRSLTHFLPNFRLPFAMPASRNGKNKSQKYSLYEHPLPSRAIARASTGTTRSGRMRTVATSVSIVAEVSETPTFEDITSDLGFSGFEDEVLGADLPCPSGIKITTPAKRYANSVGWFIVFGLRT